MGPEPAVFICSTHATQPRFADAPPDEQDANARLISAAPELLASLTALTEWCCTYTSPRDQNSPHELLIAARAAIAKAEGTDTGGDAVRAGMDAGVPLHQIEDRLDLADAMKGTDR